MPPVDFLPVAISGGANVVSQVDFAGSGYQVNGFSAGVALSNELNKVWRQSSVMTAAVANFIADSLDESVLDDGNLNGLIAQFWQALLNGSAFHDTGSTNHVSVAAPAGLTFAAPSFGLIINVKIANSNTGPTDINPFGTGALPVTNAAGAALIGGELRAGSVCQFVADGAGNMQVLSVTANIGAGILEYLDYYIGPVTADWTARDGVIYAESELWACGGAGGGSMNPGDAGGGGGAGEYRRRLESVVPGDTRAIILPSAAAGGNTSGSNGATASFSSFGSLVANSGTGGAGSPGIGVQQWVIAYGGFGGSGSGITMPGNNGGFGFILPGGAVASGIGGGAFQSPDPGLSVESIAQDGHSAAFPGGGGNGGLYGGSGGNGGPSLLIVRSRGA